MVYEPDYWFSQLAVGDTRLQYELETESGTNPASGYTGFFVPRFSERDAGPGSIYLEDVICGALSPRVQHTAIAQSDLEEFQRERTPIARVAWEDQYAGLPGKW